MARTGFYIALIVGHIGLVMMYAMIVFGRHTRTRFRVLGSRRSPLAYYLMYAPEPFAILVLLLVIGRKWSVPTTVGSVTFGLIFGGLTVNFVYESLTSWRYRAA